jgi:TetR/AcrR family fatty acid metabolism transcriptional regulator
MQVGPARQYPEAGKSVRTKTAAQAEKILTVAARFFATHRFHEARMEDIAAAAEVGKGTLYRYFKDKDELYMALLARAAEQLTCRLRGAAQQASDARGRLERFVAAVLDYFDEQPHLFDLINLAEVMRRLDADSPWGRTREESFRLVKEAFAEGQAAGDFAIRDPDLAVLLLLGSLRAVLRFGPHPRPPDLARTIVADFLYGAARPAGKAGGPHPCNGTS